MMQAYRKLHVWAKAMDLVDEIYKVSASFPREEMYGLTSQLRRSAISVPSNIAEGSQRNSSKEFIQFLAIAYSSLAEVETQLEISFRQKYLKKEQLDKLFNLTSEVGRMLNGLMTSVDKKLPTANRPLPTLAEV